jgi:Flp pilus assembly protein CpaB
MQNLSGRLTSGRSGAILLGVTAAAIAAVLLAVYVTQYRSSVNDEKTPVTVFVAKRLIPRGTPGVEIAQKRLYTPTQVAPEQVKAGAITDPALISGRSAAVDIFPGQQLSDADFAGATGVISGIAGALKGELRAVSLTVDALNGSLANLQTGDRIDIYQQLADKGGKTIVKLFRADVPVLQAPGAGGGTVILGVPAKDAADTIFASRHTDLFFVLRPIAGAKVTPPRTASTQTMLQFSRTH